MESDFAYGEIFDKISELSGIKFKFCKNGYKETKKYDSLVVKDSFLLKMSKKGYAEVLFEEVNDRFPKPSELCIVKSNGSEIPLEKYAIVAIKANNMYNISGKNKKTGKRETIFKIPEFESSIELKMKLDLF